MKTFAFHTKTNEFTAPTSRQIPRPVNYHERFIGYEKNLPEINHILRRSIIQTKYIVSSPDDPYEQEADRVAEKVMRMPEPDDEEKKPIQAKSTDSAPIRRQAELPEEQEEDEFIQTQSLNLAPTSISPGLEASLNSLEGRGQPLPEETRAFFEPRFGADFSRVRVHTDSKATEMARLLNAHAFTIGADIVFDQQKYTPSAPQGKALLAHELVHVIQQNKKQPRSPNVIQCWGPSIHRELTKNGVRKLLNNAKLEGFELDKQILDQLAGYSTSMDFRLAEFWFNLVAWFKTSFLSATTKTGKLKKLKEHYANNPVHAKNHGEGGLYFMPLSAARAENIEHQTQYVAAAHQLFRAMRRITSVNEHNRPAFSSSERNEVLRVLGDALHIAQDRGSHGEGAEGKGHGGEILTGKDPDDKKDNPEGYIAAGNNTESVLLNAFDILVALLNKKTSKP